MRKQLRFFGILTLLLAMGFGFISAQTAYNIMFIGNGSGSPTATGEDPRDSLAVAKIIEYGYTVTFISDDQTKVQDPAVAAALAACDGIVISSTVGSGDVNADTTIFYAGKPIMCWEYALWDEMLICDNTDNFPWQDTLVTLMDGIDVDLVGDLTGAVVAAKSSVDVDDYRAAFDPIASGAVVAATAASGDSTLDIYIYVENGETLLNDQASDKRQIGWGLFLNEGAPNMTDIGWELYLRAVTWLVGDVFVDPGTSTSPMPFDNKIESWFANNSLYLNISGPTRNMDVKIFDITGKMVLKRQVLGGNEVSIPMDNYANGVYIFMGDNFAGKFVKQ